jgi:ribosomal protein S18
MEIFLFGFLNLNDFPSRGPNTKEKTGFSIALILVHAIFMSNAKKQPATPTVGVIPNPVVTASKSAFDEKAVISFQLLAVSGNHKPASIAVDVFAFAKIPYTFKNGNIQKSGLRFIDCAVDTALLKRTISSRLYICPSGQTHLNNLLI